METEVIFIGMYTVRIVTVADEFLLLRIEGNSIIASDFALLMLFDNYAVIYIYICQYY